MCLSRLFRLPAILTLFVGAAVRAQPLGTAFTYQGELEISGAPFTGEADFLFRLYDAETGGMTLGPPQLQALDVDVDSGRFTIELDFGAQFGPQARWLEMEVRERPDPLPNPLPPYTLLVPRQRILPDPASTWATDAGTLGGQAPSFFQDAGNLTAGTIPNTRLAGNVARTDTAQVFTGAVSFANPACIFAGDGASLTNLSAAALTGTVADARLSPNVALLDRANAFSATNTFAGNVGVGVFSPEALFHVAEGTSGLGVKLPGLRVEQNAAMEPNVIGGIRINSVGAGVKGATIAGGGKTGVRNRAFDDYTFIGGGVQNTAGSDDGDPSNSAHATVGGGYINAASGAYAVVGGGTGNTASGYESAVLGGAGNTASGWYSTALGGTGNTASGFWSLAAGRRAQAVHRGAFVWADNTDADFSSVAMDEFAVRAAGGVRFVTQGGLSVSDGGGTAVLGEATAASGQTKGVHGQTNSSTDLAAGVFGLANAGTGSTFGVWGENNSTSGTGVYGSAPASSGTTHGVFGQSFSPDGVGVAGQGNATTGANAGVFGNTYSTQGKGVYGLAAATSGANFGGFFSSASTAGRGVYGGANAPTGTTYGGRFENLSSDGRGVYGVAYAASGNTYGGRFESDSTTGIGASGLATAVSGFNYGGSFQSESTNGIGVYGAANADSGTNFGGYFVSDSNSGRGVYGVVTTAGIFRYGVLGEATVFDGGYGVYAVGNLGASGLKPFRIDHPDDPANKYLLHYAAESPEVINFYSGKATLDGAGEAVVELPHYFAKINKDPRYTLTAIGAPMPLLHIAEEIDEAALSAGATAEAGEAAPACSFRIAGGVPGAKVSWEVKALRNDRCVQQHGAPVEVEKQGPEKGTYQHPELYGQPPEKGMNYDARHGDRPRPELPDAVLGGQTRAEPVAPGNKENP